jgi:hypothetical protein
MRHAEMQVIERADFFMTMVGFKNNTFVCANVIQKEQCFCQKYHFYTHNLPAFSRQG